MSGRWCILPQGKVKEAQKAKNTRTPMLGPLAKVLFCVGGAMGVTGRLVCREMPGVPASAKKPDGKKRFILQIGIRKKGL